MLQGSGNLAGTGNALNNSILGIAGDNSLNRGAETDVLVGHAGNDTFVFNVGQAGRRHRRRCAARWLSTCATSTSPRISPPRA